MNNNLAQPPAPAKPSQAWYDDTEKRIQDLQAMIEGYVKQHSIDPCTDLESIL